MAVFVWSAWKFITSSAICTWICAAWNQGNTSPNRAPGEFRDPNDVNIDMGMDSSGVNLDEIDTGLVDWGEFIAQCSQVWVTE